MVRVYVHRVPAHDDIEMKILYFVHNCPLWFQFVFLNQNYSALVGGFIGS
jgi:hypothetical protein